MEALEDYVAGQITANEDYRPAEIPKLENALVKQLQHTVLLLVANDYEAAAIDAYHSQIVEKTPGPIWTRCFLLLAEGAGLLHRDGVLLQQGDGDDRTACWYEGPDHRHHPRG